MIKEVLKFLNLTSEERRLLIKATFWVAALRLALWLLPYGWLRNFMAKNGKVPEGSRQGSQDRIEPVTRSVRAAGRYVPRATCLIQALAAPGLLRREGLATNLRLGVAKNRDHNFLAHAWLEYEGRIILGESQEENYTPLEGIPGGG